MKRLALLFSLLILAAIALPASGVPGPEPSPPTYFDINVNEILEAPSPHDRYDTTRFLTADGWDFGDRIGYFCAWVEFIQSGDELFEVHYELVQGYPIPIEINDRNGTEGSDQANSPLCGDGTPGEDEVWDGTDHFPHGVDLVFYDEGGAEIARIDYGLEQADSCDRGYWTPGDEPGEAWLWWDEDGPSSVDGHTALNCEDSGSPSGPEEPVPVMRAYVKNVAPGVDYCVTDRIDGDICTFVEPGPSPEPSPSPSPEPSPEPAVCFAGTLFAEDGSGRTLQARVCE